MARGSLPRRSLRGPGRGGVVADAGADEEVEGLEVVEGSRIGMASVISLGMAPFKYTCAPLWTSTFRKLVGWLEEDESAKVHAFLAVCFGVDDLDGGRGAGVDVEDVEGRVNDIESRIGPPRAKLSLAN